VTGTRLLWCVLVGGVSLGLSQPGVPPFRLQLNCLSGEWFSPGTLQVPPGVCGSLQVRLDSARFKSSDLGLTLNDQYLKHETKSADNGYVLSAESRTLEDFLRAPETEVKAEAGAGAAIWRVLKWDRPYIEASSAQESLPPAIRVTEPVGPVVRAGSGVVAVSGSVTPPDRVTVTLQGQRLPRVIDQPGFQFRGSLMLADDTREVVLRAVDERGNSTTLVWPLRKL
jgi:hypothetical protein